MEGNRREAWLKRFGVVGVVVAGVGFATLIAAAYERSESDPLHLRDAALARRAARARMAGVRIERARTKMRLYRTGHWRLPHGGPGRQLWRAEVEHDVSAGTVSGRVTVEGLARLAGARFEGRMKGSTIAGSVKDRHGVELATFEGSVSRLGARGTYRTVHGFSGTWSHDGPLIRKREPEQRPGPWARSLGGTR